MSAPQFTPGPWEYRELKDGWGIFPASVSRKNWSDDQAICGGEADYDPLWLKEPAEADARLIAAAPELYEALAAMVEWNIKRGPFDEPLGESEQDAEVNAAVAALRKARGEL